MTKVVLKISYDGTNYYGWQSQKAINNLPTIQQQLELALSKISNQPINITAAGRTDAKVHASGQIVHFDTNAKRDLKSWILGTNSYLPLDIRVLDAMEISSDFDARRTAQSRTYNYWIYNHKISPTFLRNYVTWEYKELNVEFMQKASSYWLGEHDFSSFRGKDCQSKSVNRMIYSINCYQKNNLIKITITANAFLKHMVRNMVGVLMKIGQGSAKDLHIAKEILLAKDRTKAADTAPPQGLYLTKVTYPEKFQIEKFYSDKDLNSFEF